MKQLTVSHQKTTAFYWDAYKINYVSSIFLFKSRLNKDYKNTFLETNIAHHLFKYFENEYDISYSAFSEKQKSHILHLTSYVQLKMYSCCEY